MPRYFIDMDDNATLVIDDEGQELLDDSAARRSVLAALPGMALGNTTGDDRRTFRATARNAAGKTVYTATLTLAGAWGE